MSDLVAILVPIIAANWFAFEALWAKAKLKGGCKVYAGTRGLRILYVVVVPLLLYGTVANYIKNPGERWVSGILLAVSLFGLYFYPSTILVCSDAIVSIRWFGLKRTSMEWNNVEAIYAVPEQQSIVVQDKQQNQITHTIFNIDREGFLRQLNAIPQAASGRITLRV